MDGYLTTREAAERTGTTPVLWRNRAAGGGIPGAQLVVNANHRAEWMIPATAVDAYERGTGGRPRADSTPRPV